ncbi:MAG: Dps family protein [Myxococcota bacterium]
MNMIMNRIGIEGPDAEISMQQLQGTLVDLIDLGLQAKQAHWNVVGPRFRSVHLQLDDLAEITHRFSDRIGERIVTLGEPAEGSARAVDHQSKLDPMPAEFTKDGRVVELMIERLAGVCTRIRQDLEGLGSRDPVGHDLLVECLGKLEEQMWMFHVQAQ